MFAERNGINKTLIEINEGIKLILTCWFCNWEDFLHTMSRRIMYDVSNK